MNVAGIIAEYDPFHLGHAYQIEATRAAGAEAVVVALGGDFTQRGAAAFCEKGVRARAALSCGADLVLEIPAPFAMASAERFAYGGVALLSSLGCVGTLSFGSESGNAEALWRLGEVLDAPEFSALLKEELAGGAAYASARAAAAERLFPGAAALLSGANDLLGAEYCKWIRRLEVKMRPLTIKREGVTHGAKKAGEGFASASYLRELGTVYGLRDYVPAAAFALYTQEAGRGGLPCLDGRLSPAIMAKLRSMDEEEFARVPDAAGEGLYHRVFAASRRAVDYESLCAAVKTKRYAMSRVRRVIMGAFLGFDEERIRGGLPYCHVLAMNEVGAAVLSEAKKSSALPVSASLAVLEKTSERAACFAKLESRVTDLFWLSAPSPRPCGEAYTRKLIKE